MACGTNSTAWIIGGVTATNTNIMNMYCSNFNIPVPNLFNGSSDCTNGWMSARCNNIGGTSHSLTGIWYPGYEFAFADYLTSWWVDEGTCIEIGRASCRERV